MSLVRSSGTKGREVVRLAQEGRLASSQEWLEAIKEVLDCRAHHAQPVGQDRQGGALERAEVLGGCQAGPPPSPPR